MKFTLLSVALAAIIIYLAFRGFFKGKSKGFIPAAIDLGLLILSALISALLSVYVLSDLVMTIVASTGVLDALINDLLSEIAGAYTIISALACAIISPIVFLLILGEVRLIVGLIARIAMKRFSAKEYDKENAPWYVAHSARIGSFIGCFAGILLAIITASPIIGTLKTGARIVNALVEVELIPSDAMEEGGYDAIVELADDAVATVMYKVGGEVVYDSVARSTVFDQGFILEDEVEVVLALLDDIRTLGPKIADPTNLWNSDIEKLYALCDEVEKSALARAIFSEIISGASRSWITGESYFGQPSPDFGDIAGSLFNSMLRVFAVTQPKYVVKDFRTFLGVCSIVLNSRILEYGGDYEAILSLLEDGSVLGALEAELAKNPRMAAISDDMYAMAMKSALRVIKFDGYDLGEYRDLLENLAYQYNEMMGQTAEKKVETINKYAQQYFEDYGVDVPENMTEMLVNSMVNDMDSQGGELTYDRLNDFFNQYLQDN